jgi:hypothetical protein
MTQNYNSQIQIKAALLIVVLVTFSFSNIIAQTCNGFRTQTQGGWGSKPKSNNPGSYLHRNFAAAFPNGLIVGCDNKITLTSASAVTNFLPSGSTASVLPNSTLVNPTKSSYSNVLAGQVTALKLSVTFDAYDSNFGSNSTLLKNLKVANGTFAGKTVGEILALAEKALGGCNTDYSLSEINQVVSSINENYVDGTTNKGFLSCPNTVDPCTNDIEKPVIANCPANLTKNTVFSCEPTNWVAPTATDNCELISFTSNISPGTCLPIGTTTVTYTAVDAAGNTSTCSFDVTVKYLAPLMTNNNIDKNQYNTQKTGINTQYTEGGNLNSTISVSSKIQNSKSNNVTIYPNPAIDKLNIDLQAFNGQAVDIMIYSNIGQLLQTMHIAEATRQPFQLNVNNIAAGQYILRIIAKGNSDIVKHINITK